jgi:large subunit ribosomal protein L30
MAEPVSSQKRMLRITLVKSPIGYSQRHKDTVRALGLRRLNQTVEQPDTPTMRGMVAKVNHLVVVEVVTLEAKEEE